MSRSQFKTSFEIIDQFIKNLFRCPGHPAKTFSLDEIWLNHSQHGSCFMRQGTQSPSPRPACEFYFSSNPYSSNACVGVAVAAGVLTAAYSSFAAGAGVTAAASGLG